MSIFGSFPSWVRRVQLWRHVQEGNAAPLWSVLLLPASDDKPQFLKPYFDPSPIYGKGDDAAIEFFSHELTAVGDLSGPRSMALSKGESGPIAEWAIRPKES